MADKSRRSSKAASVVANHEGGDEGVMRDFSIQSARSDGPLRLTIHEGESRTPKNFSFFVYGRLIY